MAPALFEVDGGSPKTMADEGLMGPLLTLKVHEALCAAVHAGSPTLECSLDLDRSTTTVEVDLAGWVWQSQRFPFLEACKDRTIYHWDGERFEPVARFTTSLIKLVPTHWGPPTFEIDGIKMLPTAQVSPYADAERKVGLIEPRGKVILDTCGGLGYFAAWCLAGQARQVLSFEQNPDVIWLRSLNPWSPEVGNGLTLTEGDVAEHIATLPSASVDAILHDPPRFGTAGKLYSQVFYDRLASVIRRQRQAVSLHRLAEQTHQRTRRGKRSGETFAQRRIRRGVEWRWCAGSQDVTEISTCPEARPPAQDHMPRNSCGK